MKPRTPQTKCGFTLVEVTIASAVLAISILGISMLQGAVRQTDWMSQHFGGAIAAAQAKIEEIQAQDLGSCASGSDISDPYARSWTLTPGLSAGTSGLAVTVSWTSISANAHQIGLRTILAD